MHSPKMRSCADGTMRADNGCKHQLSDVPGSTPTTSIAKTADYTVKSSETGRCFTNTGASGQVNFTLPTPKGGEWFTFVKIASQIVVVTPPNGVTINGAASLTSASGATGAGAAFLDVFAISATQYLAKAQGTWT